MTDPRIWMSVTIAAFALVLFMILVEATSGRPNETWWPIVGGLAIILIFIALPLALILEIWS